MKNVDTLPTRGLLAVIFLLLVCAPQQISAQQLVVEPQSLDLGTTRPGVPLTAQVQLTNEGSSELHITLTVQEAGFRVLPASLQLPGGERTTAKVDFVSDQLGTFAGTLTVQVKGFLKTQDFPVSLHAQVTRAQLELTPEPAAGVDMGPVQVGRSSSRDIQVRNAGQVAVRLDSAYLATGLDAFSVTAANGVTLEPGEQITLRLKFQPSAGGVQQERLVLQAREARPARLELAVRGQGLAPRAVISPIAQVGMRFGQIDLGATRTRPLTVLNEGQADLQVTGLEVSSGAYVAPMPADSSVRIAPGGRLDLPITYRPRYEGQADAQLVLSSNDPAQPRITLPLSGMAAQTPPRVDVLNESVIDFGSVAIGKAQRDQILLWNRGGAPFTATMEMQGQAPDDFALELSSVLLQPGEVRKVGIRFLPRDTGVREAELRIHTESGLHPIALTGIGKFLDLTPTALDFDRVVVGKSSSIAAEIYNFGNADFTITNVVSSNPKTFAVQSQVTPTNKFVLPADGLRPLTLGVTFSPGSRGVYTGALQLQGYWDEAFESREIVLNGSGIAADIELHPSGPFEFGHVVLGEREARTIVATNTGDTDLHVEVHPESEEASIEPAEFALGPGKSTTLQLYFSPRALGRRATKVRLISNAVKEKALPLQVTGHGALDNIDLARVVATLVSRKTHFDTLSVAWNNTPIMLPDQSKVDVVFRIPEDVRRAMIGRRFYIEWTKLDANYDEQGAPTKLEVQIEDAGEAHVLAEQLNLRLLEDGNQRVRLRISTRNHEGAPLYGISQIFEAGGWKWEIEAKPLVSFFSVRPARKYTDQDGNRVDGQTERLIGLPGIAFFGFHNAEGNGVSGIHLTAVGNVLEALSTENSIAVSIGIAVSFYRDRFMFGIARDVYDHRSREKRDGTADYLMTFKYWGLSK